MLWGCCQKQGLENCSELMERCTDDKYRDILEPNLFQSASDPRLGGRFDFQQDNDPEHTAKATLQRFKGKHLNVLEWSSQSPDLNSIENQWSDLNTAVHQWDTSNLKELEQFCLEEWAKIPLARCSKLMETKATCSYNCCKKWLFKVLTLGG